MYDAEHEIRLWMNEVNMRNEVNMNEESGVVCDIKEVVPEVSVVNKVNEEAPEASAMNKVNKENDVNVEAKVEVSGMKEVKSLKDGNKVEVFDAKVNNGKVVLRLCDKKAEAKQSRPANWDPG